MKKHRYDYYKCIASLSRKHDILIKDNVMFILRGSRAKNDLGNGSWGKIGYLWMYHGYSKLNVTSFKGL